MDRVRLAASGLGTATILVAVVGCPPPDPQLRTLRQQVDQLEVEKERLETELLARGADIADLEAQVAKLLELGPGRLEKLFVVERIELVSRTGGADYDGQMGDDGVTVYLRPLDGDGHVLKAAGEITIELLDTNDPGSPRSLGLYVHNDPEQLRRLWHGGLLTDHYTIKCPWDPAAGPPANREVTIKATFYDFLTGRRLTATTEVEVALPD
jgi:hypothetical protein